MPFEAAQARTALVSTCAAEGDELNDRFLRPPTRWALSRQPLPPAIGRGTAPNIAT